MTRRTQPQQPTPPAIDIEDEASLAHWSRELGVTPFRIRTAVEAAGPLVADVRRELMRGRLNLKG